MSATLIINNYYFLSAWTRDQINDKFPLVKNTNESQLQVK